MTLTTYNPFNFQIDRLLEETLRPVTRKPAVWTPAYTAWEDADRFTLELALPGWESKDVKITSEDGVLTVAGTRQAEENEKNRTYYVREAVWGQFSRSFTLPSYVDEGKAKASFKNGVLSIELPKREETKPRQITIEG